MILPPRVTAERGDVEGLVPGGTTRFSTGKTTHTTAAQARIASTPRGPKSALHDLPPRRLEREQALGRF
jgi:hypothetical protein